MICPECEANDGFEGDPPVEGVVLVTITSPPEAAKNNPPQLLCPEHAQQGVSNYVGFGWGVHADWKEDV